jgi:YD repeat-containing protein
MAPDGKDHTFSTRFRIPKVMWDAYGRVTTRLDTDRSARLLDHIRADIKAHGDEQDLAALAEAEQELAERRARKGGRPRRPVSSEEKTT